MFFLIFNAIGLCQDEDYVINKPTKTKTSIFSSIPNPDYTNYSLTASSYTLKKREIRISATDFIFYKGSYGLTNNTMVSLSTSFIGTLTASIKQQFNLSEDLKLGVSASAGQILGISEDTIIGFGGGQVMATLGDIQNNITLGYGLYYAKSSYEVISDEKDFLLSNIFVGTQKQLGRKIYLMAEGIYFLNYNVFSGAISVKVILKTNMAITAGLMPIGWNGRTSSRSRDETSLIPLISFRMLLNRH